MICGCNVSVRFGIGFQEPIESRRARSVSVTARVLAVATMRTGYSDDLLLVTVNDAMMDLDNSVLMMDWCEYEMADEDGCIDGCNAGDGEPKDKEPTNYDMMSFVSCMTLKQ
ncbi:hypothetical protein F0562_025808 [Nyssa sinensis]|uniref:Uncharacterized protein n=1 Tax=Nyssa sinensis TaxID=561372 RepID=A0A5J5B9S1_9ASTE|nr:hypothetical protein F0562_025808 [Nyssa sinensis]